MGITKKYNLPPCPTLYFFRDIAIDEVIRQGLVVPENNKIQAGRYSYKREKILPIQFISLDEIQKKRESPSIITISLEKTVELNWPLVQGEVDIYPNWQTFSIEGMNVPVYGITYFPETDAVSVIHAYKKKTKDKRTAQHRIEFVGGTGEFDPIDRAFRTLDSYEHLKKANGKDYYLILFLDKEHIKEIKKHARNERIDGYVKFLDRVSLLHNSVKNFLEYCDEWALKQQGKNLKDIQVSY